MIRMTEFRLTQISDTHLARRLPLLTGNFAKLSDHIDATRPDLVINTGDVAFDGPAGPDDLEFAHTLHEALPVPCRYLPGNHDIGDNPTQVCPNPKQAVTAFRSLATTAGASRPPAGALSASIRWS
jgi:3',5'-cyclic AMP phosphodiesterase CpdA